MDYEKAFHKLQRKTAILKALKTNKPIPSTNLESLPDDILSIIYFKKHQMEMKDTFLFITNNCRLGTHPVLTYGMFPDNNEMMMYFRYDEDRFMKEVNIELPLRMGTINNFKICDTIVVIEKRFWNGIFNKHFKPIAMGLITQIGKKFYTLQDTRGNVKRVSLYTKDSKNERVVYTYKQFEIYLDLFRHSKREVYINE